MSSYLVTTATLKLGPILTFVMTDPIMTGGSLLCILKLSLEIGTTYRGLRVLAEIQLLIDG